MGILVGILAGSYGILIHDRDFVCLVLLEFARIKDNILTTNQNEARIQTDILIQNGTMCNLFESP